MNGSGELSESSNCTIKAALNGNEHVCDEGAKINTNKTTRYLFGF